MPSPRRLPLAALLLACGCVETPPAAPPRPRAFQQFCEQGWSIPQVNAMAAARGAEGWELVAMYNGVLCYKRPAPDFPAARPPGALPAAPAPVNPYVPVVRDPGF